MQQVTEQYLSPAAIQTLLTAIPEKIRIAPIAHAEELEYPVEAVIEMAIAGLLDEDAITFADCKLMIANGKLKILDSMR